MYNLLQLQTDINSIATKDEFLKYLESYFIEIEAYFSSLTTQTLQDIKFDIEDLLYDLLDKGFIENDNPQIVQAYLLLVAEILEKSALIGTIKVIYPYLPESATKYRIEASMIYLNVNNIQQDFHKNFSKVMELFLKADKMEDQNPKTIIGLLNYLLAAYKAFHRVNSEELANSFKQLFVSNKSHFPFLQDDFIVEIVANISINNYLQTQKNIQEKISQFHKILTVCAIDNNTVSIEKSNYSKQLFAIKNINFEVLRNIAYKHIQREEDPKVYHDRLNKGEVIIDDENLLYKYLLSYGPMHKAKLYEAFDFILPKLNNFTVNIIDWGCGQALATILLREYIAEKQLNITIEEIIFIEPSKMALSRALLHLDVIQKSNTKIQAINKDFDCLEHQDIKFDNKNKVLHLFSNILDIESFKLNTSFFEKISKNIESDNYFMCVSPNINAKRNGRLDLFYKYFDENFNTELISSRDTNVSKYTRYEKLFEVKYTAPVEVSTARGEIQEYHIDIYDKLLHYKQYIEPTLKIKELKNVLVSDPDYVIFKIRKVSEAMTSKLYANNGGTDQDKISQNDKIRYLSHTKRILNRKTQSLLHTIRTLGNIAVHDHIDNPTKILQDDAYFILTALVLLLDDLEKNGLI